MFSCWNINKLEKIIKTTNNYKLSDKDIKNYKLSVFYVNNKQIITYFDTIGVFFVKKYILVLFDDKKYYKAYKNSNFINEITTIFDKDKRLKKIAYKTIIFKV